MISPRALDHGSVDAGRVLAQPFPLPSSRDFPGVHRRHSCGTLVNNWTNLSGDDIDSVRSPNGHPSQIHWSWRTIRWAPRREAHVHRGHLPNFPTRSAILKALLRPDRCQRCHAHLWHYMYGAEMGSARQSPHGERHPGDRRHCITGDQGNVWRQAYGPFRPRGPEQPSLMLPADHRSNHTSDITIDDVRLANGTRDTRLHGPERELRPLATVDDGTCTIACPANEVAVEIQSFPTITHRDQLGPASSTTAVLASRNVHYTVCVPRTPAWCSHHQRQPWRWDLLYWRNGSYSVFRNRGPGRHGWQICWPSE